MANIGLGYGHGDVVGVPFDFYSGATVVTGSTITMQTGLLVVSAPGAISVTVNLPLNPVDGAIAEISNASSGTLTLTAVNANTGDSISQNGLGAPTGLTVGAATAGTATCTIRYRYSLNGFQPASGAAVNPRTWIRVQ
jgi:hypothetical protein